MTKLKKFKTHVPVWDFTRNEELWKWWWKINNTHFMLARFQLNLNMFQRQFIQNWMIGRETWFLVEFQQHQSPVGIQRNLLLLLQLSVDKKTSLSKRIFEFVQFVTTHVDQSRVHVMSDGVCSCGGRYWSIFLLSVSIGFWFLWVDCFCVGDFVGMQQTKKMRERQRILLKNSFSQNKTKLNKAFFPWLSAFFVWLNYSESLVFWCILVKCVGENEDQAVWFWYWQMMHHSKTCFFIW